MRYLCAALFVMMCSASASAQGAPPGAARMSADDVVARLMRFDRNKDFKIAIDELPERMQSRRSATGRSPISTSGRSAG